MHDVGMQIQGWETDVLGAVSELQRPPDSPHPHTAALHEGLTTAGEGKVTITTLLQRKYIYLISMQQYKL